MNVEQTKRNRRPFQFTVRSLLLVIFVIAVALTFLRPGDVHVRATFVSTRLMPDSDGGSVAPFAVVQISNIGRSPVWVSGESFMAIISFHGVGASYCGYETTPLSMTLLHSGERVELEIPLQAATEEVCVGQMIGKRWCTTTDVYWSAKLKCSADVPSSGIMAAGTPPGVDSRDLLNRLRRAHETEPR